MRWLLAVCTGLSRRDCHKNLVRLVCSDVRIGARYLTISDEELLDRYFEGDADAFERFFERHSARVLAYGVSRGLAQQDALEFTQDVFLRLHKSIHTYERGRPALPWFFTIVHRLLIDTMRKLKTDQQRYTPAGSDIEQAVSSEPTGAEPDEELAQAIQQLPLAQKEIVEMRLVKDLSFREIAEKTGKSEANSRKIFERAIKALRTLSPKGGAK
jgi:RNA polymerase sigma-70 factor (ECF subfamily)